MLRRSIPILLLAAGLFGGAAAAGFLLAKGTLRHGPATAFAPGVMQRGGAGAGRGHAIAPRTGTGSGPTGGAVTVEPDASPAPVTGTGPTAAAPPVAGPGQPAAGATSPPASGGPARPAAPPTPPAVPSVPTSPAARPSAIPVIPGRFHVQVADFAERQNADALALRLRSRGYAVTVTDGPPYRVWVGGYLDRATAERLAGYLRQSGLSPTLVPQ